jgi:hypothetical protein
MICQVLEGEEGKELARHSKDRRSFVHEPPQNCPILEEEKYV